MSKNINIQMKQFNGVDYDNIYPNVPSNTVKSSEFLNGIIPSNNIDEAFESLKVDVALMLKGLAKIKLTVKSASGRPIPNVEVEGIINIDGDPIKTNSNGIVDGYIKEGNRTLKLNYADISDNSITFEALRGQKYEKELVVNMRNFVAFTRNSGTTMFSDNVNSIDVTVVGGGGGGGGGWYKEGSYPAPGGGGGGGNVIISTNVQFSPFTPYTYTLAGNAAGGTGGWRNGIDGFTTTFLGIVATGGKGGKTGSSSGGGSGGTGNGNGGNAGANGNNGKVQGYGSYTTTKLWGGGGGGGTLDSSQKSGGLHCGAKGGRQGEDGEDGYHVSADCGGGGGGGAGAGTKEKNNTSGGSGGPGAVAIRMHLKSTT